MEADSEGQRPVPNLSPLALTWALTWGSLGADLGFTWGSLGAHLVKGGSRKDQGQVIISSPRHHRIVSSEWLTPQTSTMMLLCERERCFCASTCCPNIKMFQNVFWGVSLATPGHQKCIKAVTLVRVIRGSSQGHHRVIRGSSEGHR